jgi:anti-sigma factor ChrR (cupin superfamily)
MEINADFSQRVSVHGMGAAWVPSPIPGVDRRMFDRIGDEVARATSIVRYAPGSAFSPHVYTGGEEFLVLDGVFQDEHGDFPAGTYVRNPPTSRHTPASENGCNIFVKLWQFDPDDRSPIWIETSDAVFSRQPQRPGVEFLPLFEDRRENVSLERWSAGSRVDLASPGGLEVLALDGGFVETEETFNPQSWLRLPCNTVTGVTAGALVWIKRDHLRKLLAVPQIRPA